jgi:hypothetical protein
MNGADEKRQDRHDQKFYEIDIFIGGGFGHGG